MSPGPVVVREEGSRLFAVFNDPDRELLSVHGLDPDDFFVCGTGTSGFGELEGVDGSTIHYERSHQRAA